MRSDHKPCQVVGVMMAVEAMPFFCENFFGQEDYNKLTDLMKHIIEVAYLEGFQDASDEIHQKLMDQRLHLDSYSDYIDKAWKVVGKIKKGEIPNEPLR